MVGQSIGLIQDIPTCRELLDRMAEETAAHLRKAGSLLR
jgi:NAD(P)H-dependent flavin oxidoreductase YrpB (nitropropane dioxygenase family)